MIFGYVGINYKHADQDIRDQIAFTDNQKIDFMQQSGKRELNSVLSFPPATGVRFTFLCRRK